MQEPIRQNAAPVRNPLTHRRHRRQVFWQIALPMGIGAGLLLGVAVLPWLALSRGVDFSVWADVSLIGLIILAMLLTLIPLSLIAAAAYGVTRLLSLLPVRMAALQGIADLLRHTTRDLADRSVQPFFRLSELAARWRRLWRRYS